jgi:hypothetical protein
MAYYPLVRLVFQPGVGRKRLKGKTLESPDKAYYKEVRASILLEKGLHHVKPYPHPGEDEGDPQPDLPCDSELSLCLQVVAQGDAEEDHRYRDKHDSERCRALHGHPRTVMLIGGVFIPFYFSPRIRFWRNPGARTSQRGLLHYASFVQKVLRLTNLNY